MLEAEEIVIQLFGGTVSLPAKEFQKLTPEEQTLLTALDLVLRYAYASKMLALHDFCYLPYTSYARNLLYFEANSTIKIIPPDFEVDDIKRFLEVLSLNIKAMGGYSPPPYQGSITLFCAEKGP